MKKWILCWLLVSLGWSVSGEEEREGRLLDSLARGALPQLNKKLSFSVSEVSLAEFIRAFSHDAGINVVLPTGLETPVRNNFKEVRAADMLAFLCREYDLEVEVHGSILCLTKRVAPPPLPKEVRVEYDSVRGKVLLDLQGEPLREVVKQVSHRTGVNVIAAPRVQERGVTCFVEALPVTEALGLMCRAAGLRLERVGKAAYLVDEAEREEETEEYGWDDESGRTCGWIPRGKCQWR